MIMRDSILSGLREQKMSHRRSLKVRYFPGGRIADINHYSVLLLMKQPEHIIMHVRTNYAPLKKAKSDCIHHTNITEDHLNAYGLHINGYGTMV